MQDLLAHPAIQAAIAPFVAALVVALLCWRMGEVAAGLAIISGFILTVVLTTGLALQPLTSTRKIILVSLCLPLLLPLIAFVRDKLSLTSQRWGVFIGLIVPTALLVAAISWVVWPVFSRQEIAEAWPMLARVMVYVAAIGLAFLAMTRLKSSEKAVAQGASVFALGLGTAVTSMIAASALYAQLAFSIVAAVGCLLLISLFKTPSSEVKNGVGYLGSFGLFAAVVPLALIGAAATVYAKLPGWGLLCLAVVPLFAVWPTVKISQPWLRLVATSLLALLPVIPAVWFAWDAASAISY